MAVKKATKKDAKKQASGMPAKSSEQVKVKKEEKPVKEEKLKEIGKVTHFFGGIGVAAIKLSGELKVGDTVLIKGATTDLKQKVESMQIDRKAVQSAKKGQEIGTKVDDTVREHDVVYKA